MKGKLNNNYELGIQILTYTGNGNIKVGEHYLRNAEGDAQINSTQYYSWISFVSDEYASAPNVLLLTTKNTTSLSTDLYDIEGVKIGTCSIGRIQKYFYGLASVQDCLDLSGQSSTTLNTQKLVTVDDIAEEELGVKLLSNPHVDYADDQYVEYRDLIKTFTPNPPVTPVVSTQSVYVGINGINETYENTVSHTISPLASINDTTTIVNNSNLLYTWNGATQTWPVTMINEADEAEWNTSGNISWNFTDYNSINSTYYISNRISNYKLPAGGVITLTDFWDSFSLYINDQVVDTSKQVTQATVSKTGGKTELLVIVYNNGGKVGQFSQGNTVSFNCQQNVVNELEFAFGVKFYKPTTGNSISVTSVKIVSTGQLAAKWCETPTVTKKAQGLDGYCINDVQLGELQSPSSNISSKYRVNCETSSLSGDTLDLHIITAKDVPSIINNAEYKTNVIQNGSYSTQSVWEVLISPSIIMSGKTVGNCTFKGLTVTNCLQNTTAQSILSGNGTFITNLSSGAECSASQVVGICDVRSTGNSAITDLNSVFSKDLTTVVQPAFTIGVVAPNVGILNKDTKIAELKIAYQYTINSVDYTGVFNFNLWYDANALLEPITEQEDLSKYDNIDIPADEIWYITTNNRPFQYYCFDFPSNITTEAQKDNYILNTGFQLADYKYSNYYLAVMSPNNYEGISVITKDITSTFPYKNDTRFKGKKVWSVKFQNDADRDFMIFPTVFCGYGHYNPGQVFPGYGLFAKYNGSQAAPEYYNPLEYLFVPAFEALYNKQVEFCVARWVESGSYTRERADALGKIKYMTATELGNLNRAIALKAVFGVRPSGAKNYYFQFVGCSSLQYVNINAAPNILEYCLKDCVNYNNPISNSNITTIPKSAFSGCASLTTLEFPNVTRIEEKAFESSIFSSLSIPKIIHIGKEAFCFCTINIDSYITTSNYGLCTFNYLTTIEERAFCGTYFGTNGTKVSATYFLDLGDNIVEVGKHAFDWSSNLYKIRLGKNIETIGTRAFENGLGQLQVLICEAVEPPYIGGYNIQATDISSGLNKWNVSLLVPSSSVQKYKDAYRWKRFYNIKSI